MRKALLILVLLISTSAFSQLYNARLTFYDFYAELNKDSAHVEIFRYNRYYLTGTISDEFLLPKSNSRDTLFAGKQNKIIRSQGSYYLLYYNKLSKKHGKIKLEISRTDDRELYRKQAYAYTKKRSLMRLEDSLSGPVKTIRTDYYEVINYINSGGVSSDNYAILVDRAFDSLSAKIIELKDPVAINFYNTLDSLDRLDSNRIYNLLSTANYNFFYGKYLLEKVAKEKPELLVRYIDKDPGNKKTILQTIKYHSHLYEIIKNVKTVPLKTKGKKEIVRQKRKNTISNTVAGGLYISIILAELALLTLLIVAISR